MSKPILPDSDARLIGRIARTVERQESGTPERFAILGPRSDAASGFGVRVRIGLLGDGSFGIERFSASGTRQTTTWS
jgi:hypothetical protein